MSGQRVKCLTFASARLLRLTRTPVRLEDATRTLKHNNCQNIRGETLARDKSTLVKSLASNSGTLQNSTTKRDNVQTSDPFISASCFSRTQIYINRRYSADSSLRSLQSEYGKFYADLENFVGDLPEKYKIAAPYPLHYVELIPTVLKPNDPGFVAGNMQEIVLKLLYVQGTTEAVLGKAFPFVREEENKWFQDQSERLQSRLLGVMHELRSLPCDHDGKIVTEFAQKPGEYKGINVATVRCLNAMIRVLNKGKQ